MKRFIKDEKGFTLIELLVVIAILAILATIAIPNVINAIDRARSGKDIADMRTLQGALQQYYNYHGIFPATLGDLQPTYITPTFTFKNAWGNYYYYAVLWDGKTNSSTFREYTLADPGQYPGTVAVAGVAPNLAQAVSGTLAGSLKPADAGPQDLTPSSGVCTLPGTATWTEPALTAPAAGTGYVWTDDGHALPVAQNCVGFVGTDENGNLVATFMEVIPDTTVTTTYPTYTGAVWSGPAGEP